MGLIWTLVRSIKGTIAEAAIKQGNAILEDANFGKPISEHTGAVPNSIDDDLHDRICVPLSTRGKVFGCLYVATKTSGVLNQKHLELMSLIADQISGSIANVDLLEQLQREGRRRDALAELSQAANEDLSLAHIYQMTASSLDLLIGYDRFVITKVCDDEINYERAFVDGVIVNSEYKGTKVESPSLKLVLTGDISNPDSNTRTIDLPSPNPRMQDADLHSWIQVPLGDPTTPSGTLSLRSLSLHKYSQEDLGFLERVAWEISPVLQNAKLLARAKDDAETLTDLTISLQASSDRRSTLAEIGRTISSTENIVDIFDEFARLASKLVPFKSLSYADLDLDQKTMTLKFSYGYYPETETINVPLDSSGTIAERTALSGRPLLIRATDTQPLSEIAPYLPRSADTEIKETISVPLVSNGEVFGCFYFCTNKTNTFDVEDLEMVKLISDQVSGAISNARSNEARLEAEKDRLESESRRRELSSLNEQKSEFLSTVSHELKTPLTSLTAFTDILSKNQTSNLSDRQLKQLHVMQRSARRLDVLINDLVDVAQIDGGKLKITKERFAVEDLVDEIQSAFAPIIEPKNQSLSITNHSEGAELVADRHRIAQLLTNLISNASKYSPIGSELEIIVATKDDRIELVVSDNGIGMDSLTLENMFTPFFRSDDELTQSEVGTGLGLAIVKNIVDLHGGSITAESGKGTGSTVSLELPGLVTGDEAPDLEAAMKPSFGFSD
jgi:signal transduction histidine kinase